MNFAIIENNQIINVVVCDSLESAKSLFGDNVVDITNQDVSYGDIWSENHQKFIRKAPADFYVLDDSGNWFIPGQPSSEHVYNPETSSWELPE